MSGVQGAKRGPNSVDRTEARSGAGFGRSTACCCFGGGADLDRADRRGGGFAATGARYRAAT
jgi:hypothetical protein